MERESCLRFRAQSARGGTRDADEEEHYGSVKKTKKLARFFSRNPFSLEREKQIYMRKS